MAEKVIPIGIDDYKKLIEGNYYYVDKTLLIKELLDNCAEVNLFTRPRRFGKTLNLSMLRYFFEKSVDGTSCKYLFEDKKIQNEIGEYREYQEKFPVIMLSLKSGKQQKWSDALSMLKLEITKEYLRHDYVLNHIEQESEKRKFQSVIDGTADDNVWLEGLAFLSRCLEHYHKQKVIILIDEYDVPLENAYYCGFYKEMTGFIRSLFETALKSNSSLKFAVITGCLRISKESIFTGLNNLDIISVLNVVYSEHFGFTQSELDEMLEYYDLKEKSTVFQEWYDGYVFGKTEIYNPWSVINYVKALRADKDAFPVEYWSNTSSNSIVKDLIAKADTTIQSELEALIRGESIEKVIHEDITYEDVHESKENLWNFLYFTGYLKAIEIKMVEDDRVAVLKIPNREVRKIYRQQIINWTRHTIQKKDLSILFQAVLEGDAVKLQTELSPLLVNSISYMDNYENFYHGFILGILMNLDGYKVTSNREAGDGRHDISIEGYDGLHTPVIIEFKVANKRPQLEEAVEKALTQIREKHYDAPFIEDGYEQCIHIGIGFYKKMCRVKCQMVQF